MTVNEGSFVWYELMTSDVETAQAFYAKVVGWTMADSGMTDTRYVLASTGDRPVAGLMGVPPGRADGTPRWFGYILAADVDAMAERVRDAGGAVHHPPSEIPGVGRFAVVADPQGGVFMVFRGSCDRAPEPATGTPGSIGWHELHTSNREGAFTFYQALFGWEKSYAHDMGPMGLYQIFSIDGAWTGGMMNRTGAALPEWLYYIVVDDIDAAADRVTEAGGQVTSGPHQVPDGPHPVPGGTWIVAATDPQGAPFALTGRRQA